jgi:thiol-disulfide isomerase/thioredoxin
MSVARLLTLVRAFLAVAVFAASALVIDYENAGDPAFCGAESSCHKVRVSDVGSWIAEKLHGVQPGLKLPGLALGIFVGCIALSFFVKTPLMRRAQAAVLGVGAIVAGFFIYTQVRLSLYCAYCMVVDVATLAAFATASLAALRGAPNTPAARAATEVATDSSTVLAWGAVVAVLTLLPFVWARYPDNPPLPKQLAALQEEGKVTVVSFTDFECPYCRKLHPTIEELEKREDVVVKRKMVPLDFHKGAMPTALVYVCAPAEKQDALAAKLYALDGKDMTLEGALKAAASVGISIELLADCISGGEGRSRVAADKSLFYDDLAGQGVPTTWVGATLVRGAAPERVMKAASRAGASFSLPVWAMFVVGGGALAFTVARSDGRIRAARGTQPERPTKDSSDSEKSSETEDSSEEA